MAHAHPYHIQTSSSWILSQMRNSAPKPHKLALIHLGPWSKSSLAGSWGSGTSPRSPSSQLKEKTGIATLLTPGLVLAQFYGPNLGQEWRFASEYLPLLKKNSRRIVSLSGDSRTTGAASCPEARYPSVHYTVQVHDGLHTPYTFPNFFKLKLNHLKY